MPTPKQAHALTTYFVKKYTGEYGAAPKVNRYSARWGFDAILMDMPAPDVKKLIDYYFTTVSAQSHSIEWFFYNYDKLSEAMEKYEADRKALAEIRERTRQRTEEWRARKNDDN